MLPAQSRYRVGHGLQKPFDPQRELLHHLRIELDRLLAIPARPGPRHHEEQEGERDVEQRQQGAGDDLVVHRAGLEADAGDDAGDREGHAHGEGGDQQVGRADLEVLPLDAHHHQAEARAQPEADGLADGEDRVHAVGDGADRRQGDPGDRKAEDAHEDLGGPLEQLLEVLGHGLGHHPRQQQERERLLGVGEVERGPGRREDEQVLEHARPAQGPEEERDRGGGAKADAKDGEVDVRAADGDQHQDSPDVVRDGRSHHEDPHRLGNGKERQAGERDVSGDACGAGTNGVEAGHLQEVREARPGQAGHQHATARREDGEEPLAPVKLAAGLELVLDLDGDHVDEQRQSDILRDKVEMRELYHTVIQVGQPETVHEEERGRGPEHEDYGVLQYDFPERDLFAGCMCSRHQDSPWTFTVTVKT